MNKLQHEWGLDGPRGELSIGMGKHECRVMRNSATSFRWSVLRAGVGFASGYCKTRHQAMLCAEAVLNVLEAKLWNGGKP